MPLGTLALTSIGPCRSCQDISGLRSHAGGSECTQSGDDPARTCRSYLPRINPVD